MESLINKLNYDIHITPPSRYFLTRLHHLLIRGKMGPTTSPVLAETTPPTLDKTPPVDHKKRISNKIYSVHCP